MWEYTEVAYLLANLFFRQDDFIRILINAGYSPGLIPITNSAINNWVFLLHEAEGDRKIKDIIDAGLRQKPDNEYLKKINANNGKADPTLNTRRDVAWKNEDRTRQKEALTRGQNSLLPVYFLELGAQKSRCIVFIKSPKGMGTGFVVKNDYIITNNHVIDSPATAAETNVVFNFERQTNKQYKQLMNVRLDPDAGFATNVDTDWTIIKLKENPLTKKKPLKEKVPLEEAAYLTFSEKRVKENDFVNIIQHPGGDEKMIGIYHNLVTYAKDGVVQYLTDTQEGSSGSPVLNSDWEVVALHHSSVRLDNDEDGDELRNEGSDIQLVKKEIKEHIPDIEL